MKLFGLPYWLLSLVCLGVAALYFFVYPRAAPSSPVLAFVLRYFYALTWTLLFAACVVVIATQSTGAAKPLALAALVVYLIFMASFVATRGGPGLG